MKIDLTKEQIEAIVESIEATLDRYGWGTDVEEKDITDARFLCSIIKHLGATPYSRKWVGDPNEETRKLQINTNNMPVLDSLDPGVKVDAERVERFVNVLKTTPRLPDNSNEVITGEYVKKF